MARVPLRMFGLFLLIVSLSVASCQALVHSLAPVDAAPAIQAHDIHGESRGN